MDFQFNCQFSDPVNLGNEENPDWEFSEKICSGTSTEQLPSYVSQISEEGKEFYLFKTWDYGSLFIAFLFLILILFFSAKEILDFFFGKFVKIEKKGRGRPFS